MKVFPDIQTALSEIQRDIYKAPLMNVSRVQQRDGLDLQAHEILAYTFSILPRGIPYSAQELVDIGKDFGFYYYKYDSQEILSWLRTEENTRCQLIEQVEPNELMHPALRTTIEGNWPSYTYSERLKGAMDSMVGTLRENTDSRRAFWSLWRSEDSFRAMHPTRVPCSISFHAMIRHINGKGQVEFIYNMRSSDFDTFFLSDVWLAYRFQRELSDRLLLPTGNFIMTIDSLHSFNVHDQEIY